MLSLSLTPGNAVLRKRQSSYTPPSTAIFAINGDSRTQQAVGGARSYQTTPLTTQTGNALGRNAAGWVEHMLRVLGHRVVLPLGCQFAIGAENTADIANRAVQDAGQAAGFGATVVLFLGGVNDTALSTAQTITNYTTIFNAFIAQGLRVWALDELPRNSAEASPATTLARRDWLRDPQREIDFPGYKCIQVYDALLEPATQATWKTGHSYDGLHPNYKGHKVIGETVAAAVDALWPTASFPSLLQLPTTGTTGSYLNPLRCLLAGTGGTATFGPCATGWTLSGPAAGLTLTASKGTDPDGYDEQVLAVTGSVATAAVQSFNFQSTEPSSAINALTPGQKVRLHGRIRIDAGHTGLLGIRASVCMQGTNIDTVSSGFALRRYSAFNGTWVSGSQNFEMNGEAEDYQFMTQDLLVPANWAAATGKSGFIEITPQMQGNSFPVSFTARLSRLGVRLVS